MIVIVGFIVVVGCVLGGFTISGGHIHSLIHPAEILTIGGAALGALLVMSPGKVLKDLVKVLLQCFKGSPYSKKAYEDILKAMYDLMRTARRNGMLALEEHLHHPHESAIFQKYPSVVKNHHLTEFICGALTPVMDGAISPEQLPALLEKELHTLEAEHHAPLLVLTKTADALPGFGIVAAVLGIVITMGAIDGPVEEIGHKVGAALVGTFLGILLSYGFVAPLCGKIEFMGHSELMAFRTVASIVEGFLSDLPPKVAIEQARRGLTSDVRPGQQELEESLKLIDAS